MGSLSGVVICLLGAAFWALQATMSPVNGEVLEAPLTWVIRRLSRLLRFSKGFHKAKKEILSFVEFFHADAFVTAVFAVVINVVKQA